MRKYAAAAQGVALVLGCVLIALGASMIYVPAGVITAGLLLVAGAVLDGYDDTDEEGKDGSERALLKGSVQPPHGRPPSEKR